MSAQELMHAIRARLSKRADSEHAQNFIRIIITTLFIVYLGWYYFKRPHSDMLLATWLILIFELSIALVLAVLIVLRPGVSPVRRAIGMLTDYGCMSAIMSIQGEPAAPLYAVCMWVTIGNGMHTGAATCARRRRWDARVSSRPS